MHNAQNAFDMSLKFTRPLKISLPKKTDHHMGRTEMYNAIIFVPFLKVITSSFHGNYKLTRYKPPDVPYSRWIRGQLDTVDIRRRYRTRHRHQCSLSNKWVHNEDNLLVLSAHITAPNLQQF